MDQYLAEGFDVQSPKDLPINCISGPSLVRVGKDLFVDVYTHSNVWGFICQWMVEASKEYRINVSNTNGHSDGVFCPVARGLIASTYYKTDYSQSFPGWEIFQIPEELNNFNHGKNWLTNNPSIDNNKAFSQHILDIANTWVGNFSETVPEVNMLVLDEKNVVAMKEYAPLTEWLDKRGITVHCFDLRTRSFWDGGWHCLTLDIHRDDNKTDLFPERGENGVYWRHQ